MCADDVLDAILELCDDAENDNAWHGACLSLAELARRGLLLPKRLGEVVPIVVRAMHYDVPRGQHSVGSHVRDAACYTCWAFARAYAPAILEPYVPDLSKAIVLACVFDREINCRRAASAAFQECVGRQGADNFKHGISILTAADYFTLGNRTDAYTSVAFYIAAFEEYRRPIIDCLYEDKLFHWDKEIRYLVSVSLRGLTKLDPLYFVETVLPFLVKYATHENLFVRHGAVIGVAEVVLALGKESDGTLPIEGRLLSSIADLVFSIEKARLYRGRGGEIMRSGVSRLIECMATSCVPMSMKQQVGLLDSLDANLKSPKEEIQEAAAKALAAVTRSYFPVGKQGPSERLQERLVGTYINAVQNEENSAATRGYSLALGHLPSKLLAPNIDILDSVIECLCLSSNPRTTIGGQGDAETRKYSIESLIHLCETVGLGISPDQNEEYPVVGLNSEQAKKIFRALLTATEDYNTDRRGDVGSWSRISAMIALEKLMYLAIKASDIPQGVITHDDISPNAPPPPLVPSLQSRFEALEPDAEAKAKSCFIKNESFRNERYPIRAMFFDANICSEIIGAMLKQLSEKLDVVRNQAGICLEAILTNNNPVVPFVYDRHNLVEALALSESREMHWSNPESTFPLVMRAINIDEFSHYILSGMVISIGGLTQSVTKHASKSFLEYMRALKSIKQIGKISKMGHALIRLFDEYTKDGRVILPLLVTVEKLMSHGCFDGLLAKPGNDFAKELGLKIRIEASNCVDMKRLMAIVPVALNILHCVDIDTNSTTMLFLMRFLAHRYPRIRRHTAEQLYIKLIEDGTVVRAPIGFDDATELLSQTNWSQDLGPPGNIRELRNKVAELLGVHLSEKDRQGPALKKTVKATDEFASYASLVSSAGF